MSFTSDGDDQVLRQNALSLFRNETAAAVLYLLTLFGGLAVCFLVFAARLQSPSRRRRAWLKGSATSLILHCLMGVCSSVIWALLHRAQAQVDERGRAATSQTRRMQQNAGIYTDAISSWFHYITQTLLFITVVATCVSMSTARRSGKAPEMCLTAAYILGILVSALASVIFALEITRHKFVTHRVTGIRAVDIAIVAAYIGLVLHCIMAAVAVFATAVAAATVRRSMRVGGPDKPAKLAASGGILLILSTLTQLASNVRFGWVVVTELGAPAYIHLLSVVLDTWPLLGALALLYMSAKSWDEGVAKQQVAEVA
ncbi:hypothetical protein MY11210_009149 [Beauveria gryllotalpidicola]